MSVSVSKSAVAILLLALLAVVPAGAMFNPSAVYCTASGYAYETVKTSAGSEYGVCLMPDHRYVDAWDFLRGKAGQKYNYCSKMGYASKTTRDPQVCAAVRDNSCTVCVLPDKSEVEVTRLMNLSFAETSCGDSRCVITENFQNCPADCPPSGPDGYCQGLLDLKCDKDCISGKGDPDCLYLGNPLLTILAVIIGAGAVIGLWFLLRRRKRGQ